MEQDTFCALFRSFSARIQHRLNLKLPSGSQQDARRRCAFRAKRMVAKSALGLATLLSLWGMGSVTELSAQVASTATIQGTVTDASGAVVPNAQVQVKNRGTGIVRTTTADGQGRYSVATPRWFL